jgi:hypothetical protein
VPRHRAYKQVVRCRRGTFLIHVKTILARTRREEAFGESKTDTDDADGIKVIKLAQYRRGAVFLIRAWND